MKMTKREFLSLSMMGAVAGGSQLVATADAQQRVPPKTFTIIAKNLSRRNTYVKSATPTSSPAANSSLKWSAKRPRKENKA